MQRFQGRVVIVTGAASGIGAAAARRFSGEGAAVVLVGRRDNLSAAMDGLAADRTLAHVADVADAGAAAGMVGATIARFGRLDVLVNNAGVVESGDPEAITDHQWRRVMATNVDGVFHACRAAIPHLEASGGSIVNTASVSGLGGDWGMSPYDASKGAVVNYTRALALDLGRRGVRVNAVAPSLTRTGMTESLMDDPARLAKFAERIPIGRVCEPEEVAAVIAFLASADASFVTGAIVPVDGGCSASNGQPALG